METIKKEKKQKVETKFHLDIEGTIHPWNENTITTEEIIGLGGWDSSQGAIKIDQKTQEQINLKPGQIIELKPGMGFAKKVKFIRGSR